MWWFPGVSLFFGFVVFFFAWVFFCFGVVWRAFDVGGWIFRGLSLIFCGEGGLVFGGGEGGLFQAGEFYDEVGGGDGADGGV